MASGWDRWLFEQYEFPFEVIFAKTIEAGDLNSRFDVLVFAGGGQGEAAQPAPERIPENIPLSIRPHHRRQDRAADQEIHRSRRLRGCSR